MSRGWAFALIGAAVVLFLIGLLTENWPAIERMEAEGEVISSLALFIPLIGGVLAYLGRNWYEASTRRRRLLVGIAAEIRLQLTQHLEQFAPKIAVTLQSKMIENLSRAGKGEKTLPVGVAQSGNFIFDEVRSELPDLPDDVIGPVISYYEADDFIRQMIAAFNDGRFEVKSLKHRELVLKTYFLEGARATLAAFDAIDAVAKALGRVEIWDEDMKKARSELQAIRRAGSPDAAQAYG